MAVVTFPCCGYVAQLHALSRFNFAEIAGITAIAIESLLLRCPPIEGANFMITFPIKRGWEKLPFDIRPNERLSLAGFRDLINTPSLPYLIRDFAIARPNDLLSANSSRPLTLSEVLHFAALFPGILRKNILTALGSKDQGGKNPSLWHDGYELRIDTLTRRQIDRPELILMVTSECVL